jgi:hypothetical protein
MAQAKKERVETFALPTRIRLATNYSARNLKNEILPEIFEYIKLIRAELNFAATYTEELKKENKDIGKRFRSLLKVAKDIRKPLSNRITKPAPQRVKKGDRIENAILSKKAFVKAACVDYYNKKVKRYAGTQLMDVLQIMDSLEIFLKERNMKFEYFKLLYVISLHHWFAYPDLQHWNIPLSYARRNIKKLILSGLVEEIKNNNTKAFKITTAGVALIHSYRLKTTRRMSRIIRISDINLNGIVPIKTITEDEQTEPRQPDTRTGTIH